MRAVSPHSTHALATFATLLTLAGCYGQLEAPSSAEPLPPEVTPERPAAPSVAGTGASAGAMADLGPILKKLGTDVATPAERPGNASWRTGELQKLSELTLQLCGAGGPGCRAALTDVVAANVPGDELVPLLGGFMGALRPHAEIGFGTLGRRLLTDPVGRTRDLAFRIAVGAGVTRRGDADAEGRRATLVPQSPAAGDPAVVLVEIGSPCPEVTGEVKGPDDRGRIDVNLRPDCDDVPEAEPTADGLPRALRAVWSLPLDSLTEYGTSIWFVGADAPLLAYRPVPGPAAPSEK